MEKDDTNLPPETSAEPLRGETRPTTGAIAGGSLQKKRPRIAEKLSENEKMGHKIRYRTAY